MDLSWNDVNDQELGFPTMASSPTVAGTQLHQGCTPRRFIDDDEEDGFAGLDPCDSLHEYHGYSQPQAPQFVWRISEASRNTLASRIAATSPPSGPAFRLPSRHTLTRYSQSYADMFHKHYPMLHMPTYSIEACPPELSLALAAIGAQYRFEFSNGLELYSTARRITLQRLRRCRNQSSLADSVLPPTGADCGNLDNISTIILLMAFSLWMDDPALLSEALELQIPLAHALHQDGLHDLEWRTRPDEWQNWVSAERRRRTKLIGFAYLNVLAITYNTPPLVFATEIDLYLPCASAEWAAVSASAWNRLKTTDLPTLSFQEGLNHLLFDQDSVQNVHGPSWLSPLALFVLLQGLLQKILLARQMQSISAIALRECDLDLLEYNQHNSEVPCSC